jgi:tRNA A37 threonylcarbamoyladenosine synthetase subunit TsaC/SUA5/YrdC
MIDLSPAYYNTSLNLENRLKSQDVTVIRTTSGYQLATLANSSESVNKILSFKDKKLDSNVIYLFSDIEHVRSATLPFPNYIEMLMLTLNQGSAVFILPSNKTICDSDFIACCLPAHAENAQIVKSLAFPLVTSSANVAGWPPATNIEMMESYFGYEFARQAHTWVDYTWIEPMVLNCSIEGQVIIERPGVISFDEVRSLLPTRIKLDKNYQFGNSVEKMIISEYDVNTVSPTQRIVVMGTKKILHSILDVTIPEHFHIFTAGNITLLNIGSQTNPETIARNLYHNLFLARKQEPDAIYLLNDKWGRSNWAEIIEYNLKKYTILQK